MLIFSNPSTRPRKKAKTTTKARKPRAAKKGASAMAKKHRSAAQRAATARMLAANRSRKRTHNPSKRRAAPRKASRRRVHHNPSRARAAYASAKGFLGELASTQGLIMLAAAAAAPTVVDTVHGFIPLPDQYKQGWFGLLGKAAVAVGIGYALDKVAKQRKAAIGFTVGAAGSLIAQAVRTYQVAQVIPAVTPAAQDQIAENPAMYKALMNGGQFDSMNGYEAAPMGGYESASMGDEFESLN